MMGAGHRAGPLAPSPPAPRIAGHSGPVILSAGPLVNARTLRSLRLRVDRAVRAATGQNTSSLLAAAITPAVYLRSGNGESRLGGLPRGTFPWPRWQGEPMLFVLALWLPEVRLHDPEGTLPPLGWLNVFLAHEVLAGMAPPDACAVVVAPEEGVGELEPPEPGLLFPPISLAFSTGLHMVPQDVEFGSIEEESRAFTEWEALGFETLPEELEGLRGEDYLLGKGLYSSPVAAGGVHDLRAWARERWGEEGLAFRSLLSLRSGGMWSGLKGSGLRSVMLSVPSLDLRAGDFSRALVDVEPE